MKRFLCALLALCLLMGSLPALALTGEEALGLGEAAETGVSSGYPVLQLGSRDGEDSAASVVLLQNRLHQLGYLSGAADGQFGSMTETAVIRFQEVNGLTPTGIADDSTQSLLFSGTALPAPVEATADNEVLRVQQALQRWGFLVGSADGVVGEDTETAVAEFKNYVFNVNRALYGSYAPAEEPVQSVAVAPGEQPVAMDVPLEQNKIYVGGEDGEITDEVLRFVNGEYPFQAFQMLLQKGSEGPEVWRLQRKLKQLNYLFKPDGGFGSLTENALKYFQRKNGLPETGVADQATQEALYSVNALASEEYVFPYKIVINRSEQRLYVYEWNGENYDTEMARTKCSTGKYGTETPAGVFQAAGKVHLDEWYYFSEYNSYAKYAYRVVGGVMIHSVLFRSKNQGPTSSSVKALGKPASHGCIRLPVKNAQWIWENCPEGTTVVVI